MQRAIAMACVVLAMPAAAAPAPTVAVFGFDLVNTSPAPTTTEENARLDRLGHDLAGALQRSGRYTALDLGQTGARLRQTSAIADCNGCERPPALAAGATLAAYGWVQKVSNLILNLNVVVEDARTGRRLAGGSVDIRGNTDESWDRGLRFLLEEHVLGTQ